MDMLEFEIELDESYFGSHCKSKCGRSAACKSAVFVLLKRDCKVYSDFSRSYDMNEFNHFRINHSLQFAENQDHINGIENSWSQAKRHLRKNEL